MSHTAEVRVKIESPNIQLLKAAIQLLLQQVLNLNNVNIVEGGEVRYYGRTIKTDLYIPKLDIGIKVENGEVRIVGEKFAADLIAEKLQDAYIAIAVLMSLLQKGYNVNLAYNNTTGTFEIVGVAV